MLTIKLILLATITFDLLFLLVLTRNKESLTVKIFALQIISTIGWTFCILLNLWFASPVIEKFIFAFVPIGLTAQLWFIQLWGKDIPKQRIPLGWTIYVGAFFTLMSFYPGALFTSVTISPAGYTILENGFLSAGYSLFVIGYIAFSIYLLYKKYAFAVETKMRKQAFHLLWGFCIFFIVNILTNSILPVFFNIYFFNAAGPAFSLVLIGFILYTIAHHHFLEIKIILQRSIIYSTLLALVVGTYIFIVFAIGYFFQGRGGIVTLWGAGITTIIGVFGVAPLKQYFQKITDKIFFKDSYDYLKLMQDLSDILNKYITFDTIVDKSAHVLAENLRVTHVSFSFSKKSIEDEGNDAPEDNLIIPITLNNTTTGQLIVGEKISGDPFSETDLRLLKTFTSQAAVALEKARLYKQVHEHSKNLEKKVEERTAEIKNLQEDQERTMLDISHGLQTPLTIMKGELALLKKQGYDNKKIETIDRSIDRVSNFIYQLLALSHLDISGGNIDVEDVDISELVYNLAEDLSVVAQKKNILLTHAIIPGIIMRGKKDKLEDLVANLINNSIKYTKQESDKKLIRIELSTIKSQIRLVIRDSGIGISKEDLPHIFDRFYRTKEASSNDEDGAGLGLAICKKIVSLHGGTIRAESKLGEGSSFVVVFPYVKK